MYTIFYHFIKTILLIDQQKLEFKTLKPQGKYPCLLRVYSKEMLIIDYNYNCLCIILLHNLLSKVNGHPRF